MFCPRCGRPVSPTANFCGGCGLPKSEIEKAAAPVQPQVVVPQPAPQVTDAEISELNGTLSRLEGDLTGINPVENYTTDNTVITNAVTATDVEIPQEVKTAADNQHTATVNRYEYSRNAPQHPIYTQNNYEQIQPVQPAVTAQDRNLTTVDFLWMMLMSSIPVVGLFYVIYQAFVQKENETRKAWARATVILYLFATLLAVVFSIGIALTSFIYW